MEPVQLAAILAAAIVVASMVSVELGISVALVELALGVALGNVFSFDLNASWLVFIAGFASIVLTFLAGAEVDPDDFRERFGASMAIGLRSRCRRSSSHPTTAFLALVGALLTIASLLAAQRSGLVGIIGLVFLGFGIIGVCQSLLVGIGVLAPGTHDRPQGRGK